MRSLDPRLIMVTCGSYRRGKPTCGDVDVLITHPDGESHVGVFSRLINKLHEQGESLCSPKRPFEGLNMRLDACCAQCTYLTNTGYSLTGTAEVAF